MALQHIDIIIPSNNIEDLEYCLDSLLQNLNLDQYKFEIIIPFNNINKDDRILFSQLITKSPYKKLSIAPIFFKKNVSLATCINSSIKHIDNKNVKPIYVGFLHDDSIITKDFIESSIYSISNNEKFAGCGAITYNNLDDTCLSKVKSLFKKSSDHNFNIAKFDNNINDINKCKDNIFNIRKKLSNITNNNQINILIDQINEQKNIISHKLEILKKHIDQTFDKNEYYELNNNETFGLFGALFKYKIFKDALFNEDLISSINIENDYIKTLYKLNKSVIINPSSFVLHKCKLFDFTNKNLIQTKKLKKATIDNINLVHNFNNRTEKKEYVVYTCILEHEHLPNIKYYDIDHCEYVCFTTNDHTYNFRNTRHPWKIYNVKDIALGLNIPFDSEKLRTFFKLNPHLFFKSFNVSIWINVLNISLFYNNITELVRLIPPGTTTLTLGSNEFNCSYRYLLNKYKRDLIHPDDKNKILQIYKWYKFPQDIGMIDDNLIIRRHNNIMCKVIMNKIWYYVKNINLDVKLFFNFCFWLFKRNYQMIPANILYKHLSFTIKQYEDK